MAYDKLLAGLPDIARLQAASTALPDFSKARFCGDARVFWTKAQYKQEKDRRGEGTSLDSDDSTPKMLWFLVDESGNTLGSDRIEAIREYAKACWETMYNSSKAPETWGRRNNELWLQYEVAMCLRFRELNFCADRWKCHEIGAVDYGSWLAARRRTETRVVKKREREASKDADDRSGRIPKKSRVRGGDEVRDNRLAVLDMHNPPAAATASSSINHPAHPCNKRCASSTNRAVRRSPIKRRNVVDRSAAPGFSSTASPADARNRYR